MTRAETIAIELTIDGLLRDAEAGRTNSTGSVAGEDYVVTGGYAFEEAKRWRDKLTTLLTRLQGDS